MASQLLLRNSQWHTFNMKVWHHTSWKSDIQRLTNSKYDIYTPINIYRYTRIYWVWKFWNHNIHTSISHIYAVQYVLSMHNFEGLRVLRMLMFWKFWGLWAYWAYFRFFGVRGLYKFLRRFIHIFISNFNIYIFFTKQFFTFHSNRVNVKTKLCFVPRWDSNLRPYAFVASVLPLDQYLGIYIRIYIYIYIYICYKILIT